MAEYAPWSPEPPTREQILAEPAGARMDEWVAQYVMGGAVASYSRWVGDAWTVVEKFRDEHRDMVINNCPVGTCHTHEGKVPFEIQTFIREGKPWAFCAFQYPGGMRAESANAETVPLAICRAALLIRVAAK